MLEIKNLQVATENRQILRGVDLTVHQKDVTVLFGSNGSGKSTLIKTIMGLSGFQVTAGEILFEGADITGLSVSDRVIKGIGIMFQNPPKIHGVTLLQIAEHLEKDKERIQKLAKELKVEEFLERDINVNFSGGEVKRAELFQVLLSKPKLLLLDEPESGVDIENISVMGKALNRYLTTNDCGCLIITHTGHILEYIKAKKGCVLIEGAICCYSKPEKIFHTIQEYGYEKCKTCTHEVDL